jgi:hypothetical protein
VAPQSTPTGALLTVPLPVPVLVTVTAKVWRVKVAVTARARIGGISAVFGFRQRMF